MYIQKEGMEWLLPKDDPYRDEILSISQKDYKYLPDADIVVLFKVQEDVWKEKMLKRNRKIDHVLVESGYYSMQENIQTALRTWSSERGRTLIEYNQKYANAAFVARDVLDLIASVPPTPTNRAQGKSTPSAGPAP